MAIIIIEETLAQRKRRMMREISDSNLEKWK